MDRRATVGPIRMPRTAGQFDCGWEGLDSWPATSPRARDEVDRAWILDVDRTLIDATMMRPHRVGPVQLGQPGSDDQQGP